MKEEDARLGDLANALKALPYTPKTAQQYNELRTVVVRQLKTLFPWYEDRPDPGMQVKSKHRLVTTALLHLMLEGVRYIDQVEKYIIRDLNLLNSLREAGDKLRPLKVSGLAKLHGERQTVELLSSAGGMPEWERLCWRQRLGWDKSPGETPETLTLTHEQARLQSLQAACLWPSGLGIRRIVMEGGVVEISNESGLNRPLTFQSWAAKEAAAHTIHSLLKEKPMLDLNQPAIVTRTPLILGKPAEQVTDQEIFNAISDLETQVEVLNKVKNKPKALQGQIRELGDKIQALVDFSDSRYVGKTAQVQPVAEARALETRGPIIDSRS